MSLPNDMSAVAVQQTLATKISLQQREHFGIFHSSQTPVVVLQLNPIELTARIFDKAVFAIKIASSACRLSAGSYYFDSVLV